MKNTQIDTILRAAFQLGERYRAVHDAGRLSEAHDAWEEFEEYVAGVMLDENGDTEVIDEESKRRARYES